MNPKKQIRPLARHGIGGAMDRLWRALIHPQHTEILMARQGHSYIREPRAGGGGGGR